MMKELCYSDRDQQMCRKFEDLFKKKVTFKDVTEEILSAREVLRKPDGTVWKEENPNTLKTDKLLSRLLLCKSKTSKRSIPAHESLSKPCYR